MSQLIKPQNPRINWGNPLTKGLVFDTPFFEKGGTSINELANKNTGTTNGSNIWKNDLYGSVLNFDGSTNFVSFSPTPLNFQDASPFSIIALINTSQATTGQIISTWNFLSASGWAFEIGDGTAGVINLLISNSGGTSARNLKSTGTINNGTWRFVAGTYTGNQSVTGMTLYIDGVQTGGVTVSNTSPGSITNSVLNIGKIGGGTPEFFNGKIALVRVWNRVLIPQEVKQLYTNPFQIYQRPAFPYANLSAFTWQQLAQLEQPYPERWEVVDY